ncbi:hypothetical protein DRQ53_02390 [bacterium]|nr:MAG: hypothetical protein DRQ32_08935 [bacterium]RKZ17831.1 MAG: hypothetical protein DRQ53_02390 [bacterium]
MTGNSPLTHSRRRSVALWVIAFVCVLAAASWQRMTGPSHPLGGSIEFSGRQVDYDLIRSENSDRDAIVQIGHEPAIKAATLHYRRHGTSDTFSREAMSLTDENWAAALPQQPAAGKLDYFLTLDSADQQSRIPADSTRFVVIRFKDPVPALVLIPHILMMFVSMLCGLRAGLAALFEAGAGRRMVWVTLFCLTVGGLFLGPIVQKYAFGAYWTGWPVGEDLTDTKTLVMWAGWAFAAGLVGRSGRIAGRARAAMVIATVLMLGVYIVPHSVRGSTLDYEMLDEGVQPEDAVRTG